MSSPGGTFYPWVAQHANILNNLAFNLISVERLVSGAAYVIGLAFAFKAIYTLKAYGESKMMSSSNANMKEPIAYLLVAGIFIFLPTGLSIMFQTTFGSSSPLQFTPSSDQIGGTIFGSSSLVGKALSTIIQTIGMIAFIRGWILIARHASQGQPPGGTGKGLMHVFGGILAMNIVGTLEIINNTLYGTR